MGGLAQNVQKPPPGKNVQIPKVKYFRNAKVKFPRSNSQGQIPKVKFPKVKYFGNAKVKFPRSNSQGQISQGQIFQECQGQISQGQIPKVKWENKNGKNAKVKYFRNLWNVRNVRNVWNVRNFRNVWNVRNVKTKMGNTK